MFSCNLPPALFGRKTGIFYVLLWKHGGGTDTEIRVSTESRPWRRKFSRRSGRDSNPQPFSHESGALTTELSPAPSLRPQKPCGLLGTGKGVVVVVGGGGSELRSCVKVEVDVLVSRP